MDNKSLCAFLIALVFLAGCESWNPCVIASKKILDVPHATFCWVPVGMAEVIENCRNADAQPSLRACVEELRPTTTFFTGEELAGNHLRMCMNSKGWQHALVDGVILAGAT